MTLETCPICKGTGWEESPEAFSIRMNHPSYTCGGCCVKDGRTIWHSDQYRPNPYGKGLRKKENV